MWPKDIIFSFWHDYLQQFFLKTNIVEYTKLIYVYLAVIWKLYLSRESKNFKIAHDSYTIVDGDVRFFLLIFMADLWWLSLKMWNVPNYSNVKEN